MNLFFPPENAKDLNVFKNILHVSYVLENGQKDSKVIKWDMEKLDRKKLCPEFIPSAGWGTEEQARGVSVFWSTQMDRAGHGAREPETNQLSSENPVTTSAWHGT